MKQTPVISQSLYTLLHSLKPSGHRYRIWQAGTAMSPEELLARLQQQRSPSLHKPCHVWEHTALVEGVERAGWRICFSSTKARAPHVGVDSGYFIEDLLALDRVIAWLERQTPDDCLAVLLRKASLSTFLATYYQRCFGITVPQPFPLRLPIWCSYLESLINSVNATGHYDHVACRAATLLAWLGTISAIFRDGRRASVELDDVEHEWALTDDAQRKGAQ